MLFVHVKGHSEDKVNDKADDRQHIQRIQPAKRALLNPDVKSFPTRGPPPSETEIQILLKSSDISAPAPRSQQQRRRAGYRVKVKAL